MTAAAPSRPVPAPVPAPAAPAVPTPPDTPTPPPPLRCNPDFRRLLIAATAAKLGTQVGFLAIPLVAITALHATPGQVGLLAALGNLAWLLIGLPAGAWVDRLSRRRVMIAADLARFALLASIPAAWWLGRLTFLQLCAVVLAVGAATVFFDIADQSMLPALVGREAVTGANGVLVGLDSALAIGGRSGAGWLVSTVGGAVAVGLDAVGFLWSALFVARIRAREEPRPVRRARLLGEVKAGIAFVAGHPVLRPIAVSGTCTNVAVTVVITLLPLLFIREAGLGGVALGLFFAAGGAGTLAGALFSGRLVRAFGRRATLLAVPAATSAFAFLVPLAGHGTGMWIATAGWIAACVRFGVSNVAAVAYRQQATPDELLGRMNATMRVLFTGSMVVSALLAGVLAEWIGVRGAMWLGAAGLALSWLPLFALPRDRDRATR